MAENGKFSGREVVIVEAARLPVGRGHEEKGYYKDVHASSLLAKTYEELLKRAHDHRATGEINASVPKGTDPATLSARRKLSSLLFS